MQKLIIIILLLAFSIIGCDDNTMQHDAAVDADVDSDVTDADVIDSDVTDADDSDVYAPVCDGGSECIPWVPSEVIPSEQNLRFDDLVCAEPYGPGMMSRVGTGNTFPVNCWMENLSQYSVFLVDLQTFDATMISNQNTYDPFINGDVLVSTTSPNDKLAISRWDKETGEWPVIVGNNYFSAKTGMVGDGFIVFQYNEGADTENDYGLGFLDLTSNEGIVRLCPASYVILGYFAGEELVAWSEAEIVEPATIVRLKVYEPLTKTTKRVILPPDIGYPLYPSSSGRKVVFYTFLKGCNNSVYDLYVYDFDTEEVKPLSNDLWWDEDHAYAFTYPLIVYTDHKIGCYGYNVSGNYDISSSFLMIYDFETGIRRPLGITSGPDWTTSGITFTSDWKLVYKRSTWSQPQLYILDLVSAGIVDSSGHVIPDPTYPPQ